MGEGEEGVRSFRVVFRGTPIMLLSSDGAVGISEAWSHQVEILRFNPEICPSSPWAEVRRFGASVS